MADVPKRLAGPVLLTNSTATLYTVPGSTTTIIRNIHIANTSGSAATVKLSIGADAAGTRLLGDLSIPANGTYDWSGFAVMEATELLKGHSGTTNVLTITVSGVETATLTADGAWTDYTPSLTAVTTNPTLGSSTIAGRYKAIGTNTYAVSIELAITTGGAWNAGSGEWKFSLPSGLTSNATIPNLGACHVYDSGTARFSGTAFIATGATVIWPIVVADSTGDRVLKHNNPVTWATGDRVNLQVVVEVA